MSTLGDPLVCCIPELVSRISTQPMIKHLYIIRPVCAFCLLADFSLGMGNLLPEEGITAIMERVPRDAEGDVTLRYSYTPSAVPP